MLILVLLLAGGLHWGATAPVGTSNATVRHDSRVFIEPTSLESPADKFTMTNRRFYENVYVCTLNKADLKNLYTITVNGKPDEEKRVFIMQEEPKSASAGPAPPVDKTLVRSTTPAKKKELQPSEVLDEIEARPEWVPSRDSRALSNEGTGRVMGDTFHVEFFTPGQKNPVVIKGRP